MEKFIRKSKRNETTIRMVHPAINDWHKSAKIQRKQMDFAYGFRPIYYFSRMFGLMPFSITYNSDVATHELRVGTLDCVWFVISICLYISLAIFQCDNIILPKSSNSSYLMIHSDYMILIMGLLIGALTIAMDMYNRFKMFNILKMFNTFDKKLMVKAQRSEIQFDYEKEYRNNIVCCAVGTVVAIFLFVTTYLFYNLFDHFTAFELFNYYGSYLFQFASLFIPSMSYITFLRNLHKRFVALNSFLRNRLLNEKTTELLINSNKEDTVRAIKFIGREHSYLIDIMDDVNICYSFQVMFIMAYTFAYSVLGFYTGYRYLRDRTELYRDSTWIHFKWELYFLVIVLLVLYTSNRVANEGKRTAHIVHEILNCYNEVDVVAFSLTQLSQQLQHRHAIASCGFFVFDWTLLFTMGAATTTYLTILFNFE